MAYRVPPWRMPNFIPLPIMVQQYQAPSQLVMSVQGQEYLTTSMLAALSPKERKLVLGERLHRLIRHMYPDLAGKLTGMLLEIDDAELLNLLRNYKSLKTKVEEAVAVLQAYTGATILTQPTTVQGEIEITDQCVTWSVKKRFLKAEPSHHVRSPYFNCVAKGRSGCRPKEYFEFIPGVNERACVRICNIENSLQDYNCLLSEVVLDKLFHSTDCTKLIPSTDEWEGLARNSGVTSGTDEVYDRFQVHLKAWRKADTEPICLHQQCIQDVSQTPPSGLEDCPIDTKFEFFKRWHKDESYADMIVKVADEQFTIHKLVFASRSRVFDRIFRQNQAVAYDDCLEVTDMSPKAFECLIEYMYTGWVSGLDNYTKDLLIAAEKYELDDLKEMCVEALERNISEDTAHSTSSLAGLRCTPDLKKVALRSS